MTTHETAVLRRLARIERLLDAVAAAQGIEMKEIHDMSEASDALKAEVDQIKTEDGEVHAAVAQAGTKFAAMQARIEQLLATPPAGMSDEEATALKNELAEVGGHLTDAATALNTESSAPTP